LDKKLLNLKKITTGFIFFGKTLKNWTGKGKGRPVFSKKE